MTVLSSQQQAMDVHFMRIALAYARRHIGATAENPSVGCVIVNGHNIVGVSSTSLGGRPHAEVSALRRAGQKAVGATAYVTLEPCAHHGKTPPCAEALIAAGIQRVVIGSGDPFSEVSGKGVALLKAANIEVVENCLKKEAQEVHRGFLKRVEKGLPWVSLKVATSLDGKIALENGESQWITGEKSRAYGHMLRARHDAIISGIGTVLADNPMFTCRLNGLEAMSPIRVILDRELLIPESSALVESASVVPLWIMTSSLDIKKKQYLQKRGVSIFSVNTDKKGHLDLREVLEILASKGVNSVLVEAGAGVNAGFIASNLVDELYWFQAPIVLGGSAKDACADLSYNFLDQATRWTPRAVKYFESDILRIFRL